MRYRKLGRRLFLTGAGGAMLALPWMPSLLPRALRRVAEAQDDRTPKRFVAFKTYNGTPVRDFYPRNAPPGYSTHGNDGTVALNDIATQATGRHSSGNEYFARTAPLSDFAATGLSNVFGTEFNRHHAMMNLFRGLDLMPNLNHNHGGMLGNFGLRTNGVGGALPGAQINVTIDHVMAASSNVYPTAPVGPSILHVGSRVNTCSYGPSGGLLDVGEGAVVQAQARVDPQVAFNTVFQNLSDPEPGEPTLSVSGRLIDRVIEDYRRASNSPNLSAEDRQSLERHMTHLSELEGRLTSSEGFTCDTEGREPGSLDTGGEFNVNVGDVATFWDNMIDVVALALACDATRIVTVDVTKQVIDDGGDVFGMGDSENPNSSGRNNWHLQAHNWDGNAIRWLGQGAQWVANNVILRLLDRMAEVTETDGESLLHHSMVMWGNELSFNHLNYSLPTAMWGRAGGYFNTGMYVDYIDHDRPIRFSQHDGSVIEGVQYNRLMVTAMQAMGLEPSEYEREAGRGFGETSPVEKGGGFALDYDDSNVGQPLPVIVAG
ncbi:MAG: DUF1552 domain-containing protein [Sandaracinaceae bacterium]